MAVDEQKQIGHHPRSHPTRERPWLMSHNRKLRHLRGITIRNLTMVPKSCRSIGVDDKAILSIPDSPVKAFPIVKSTKSMYQQSPDHLDSQRRDLHGNGSLCQATNLIKPDTRSCSRNLTRRMTVEWTDACSLTRQRRMEDITTICPANTFFTLHIESQDEPVYISEVTEKAMNPNFRFFDLGLCGPVVTRSEELNIRIWARGQGRSDWQYLIDSTVQLPSLQYVGETLENFRQPHVQNCIFYHMTDGIYTALASLPMEEECCHEICVPPIKHHDNTKLFSSSYDALMRLSTLNDCIQDALATRDEIANDIATILAANGQAIRILEQLPEKQQCSQNVEAILSAEKSQLLTAQKKQDEFEASIKYRHQRMQTGREQQSKVDNEQQQQQTELVKVKVNFNTLTEDITGQRRRICEDLFSIYPIKALPGKLYSYTIRDLSLPGCVFEDAKEDVTSAALGYVSQVVSLLSPYLSVTLPYPINLQGSTSTINDPLAIGLNSKHSIRTYPLYMKGVISYHFEYGVFLLNKNIEILSNALGLKPANISHTLLNLKNLLHVATAGKGHLPVRRAGGVKGLTMQDNDR